MTATQTPATAAPEAGAVLRDILTFWQSPEAWGDEATLTHTAGMFGPIADRARMLLASDAELIRKMKAGEPYSGELLRPTPPTPRGESGAREALSRTANALHNAATELYHRGAPNADDYTKIATDAWAELSTPIPTGEGASAVTVADYNAVFDPADEAGRDAYTEGFREGWIFAQTPDGADYDEVRESYGRAVDIEPQEAWDGYRDEWFKHLPLAALPTIGDPA